MLQLPPRFATVILSFAPLFFQRSWRHAEVLLLGAILAPGTRTVTRLLRITGLAQERHFVNYHRVLNRAVWSSLGASHILLGLLLVAFFMVVYYRLPGAIAVIALLYYTALTYALFRLVPVTLTLAGVAGFILSIGMAVDANVLTFERLKEELRAGKSLRAAVEEGRRRAFPSIAYSNAATILTAAILFYFGTGTVKGFALTLGIGVAVSFFTAVIVTQMLLHGAIEFARLRRRTLYGVEERPTEAREGREPRAAAAV